MSSTFQKFKGLHASGEIFLLPNAWDARSAKAFQECGFPAVATSSAAVANSLGFDDGERMSFQDYLFVTRRILSSVSIPLTVDIETGYGDNDEDIAANILQLAELGVAGINIEDSIIKESGRSLKDPIIFARTIGHIKKKLEAKALQLFVNVRCDSHLLNVDNKQGETITRVRIYNQSGADGIFIPFLKNEKDITEVVANSTLPLNVMCVPDLPDLDSLSRLGVKRVSMGPFMFQKVYSDIRTLSKSIISSRTFSALLS